MSTEAKSRALRARGPLAIGSLALLILVGVIGVWSVQARISGAVIASGLIEVQSNRQVLQHPQGGVVGELLVRDGDAVHAGEVVLRFDDTQLRSELAITEGQLFEVQARMSRLVAERDGLSDLVVPDDLAARATGSPEIRDLLDGQARLFRARGVSLEQNAAQIAEQIAQAENQIAGAEAQLAALETQRGLIDTELADSRSLLEKGLTQASRVSSLQREQARLQGEIGSVTAGIAQLKGQIAALNIERLGLTTGLREDAIAQLRDLRVQEVELVQRRVSTLDTLSRMELRTPVSGIIHGSTVFALQSVVSPAEPVMYVVPQDQPLVISARIDPIHIDQVQIGQQATLRFAALDQRLTPEIAGRVTGLSADIVTDQSTGLTFYEAELVPRHDDLGKLGGQPLLPGMPVEAFIRTADRSPLSYLAKPLTDYFARAFREG
ncbi:HlyD family type I secretion periplasmic adaptor subunit [Roseobacter sp. S98]|uniref:HlyD family type I secretion periplasmic adaptor subunit n=1 Tax=Roseobacter algicola (ex Choi et al. 2025) (nom. illeg.) TaxID=3092138 RepID=UPI003F511740